MPKISARTVRIVTVTIVLALLSGRGGAVPNADAPIIRTVDIGHGIALHYVEAGHRNARDFCPRFAERRRVLGGPDRPIC